MSQTSAHTSTTQKCFHCGDSITGSSIVFEEKSFCCDGCKTVYSILQQNNLCNYYAIEQTPGNSQKAQIQESKYAFLDLPEIQEQVLDFNDGDTARVTFYIPSIHCSSCIWLLEKLYRLNEGVTSSRVDFVRKQINVVFKPNEISLKQLVVLLTSIGYEPLISLNDVVKKNDKSNQNALVKKIAVAGFCFGNIMLLSFPEYFGFDVYSRQNFPLLFSILNIVLSIPVLVYSGWGYIASAWQSIRQKYINIDVPLALGIITLAGRSLYEIVSQTGAGYFDTLAGLIFFLLVGKWFQTRTYNFLSFERDYKSYFPLAVTTIVNGKEKTIPAGQIKKGDRLLIRHNELIPADGILMRGNSSIDYSFVTGETRPVDKVLGEMVYAGGRQLGAAIEVEVVKEVSQSYLTQLWNNEAFTKRDKSRLVSFSDKVSKYFTIALLSLAISTTIVWLFVGDSAKAWGAFTAILIVACPCALALSTPFTLGNALRILGKNKMYLKNADVVEQMAQINQIVFDKTGTLTQNNSQEITFTGVLSSEEKERVAATVKNSSHPLSRSIYEHLDLNPKTDITTCKEVAGKGIEGEIEGSTIQIGSDTFVGIAGTIATNGFDTPLTQVFVSIDNELKGYFAFTNKYRDGIDSLTKNLRTDYTLHVLSGDNNGEQIALQHWFSKGNLHFNCKPQHKLDFISSLQSDAKNVMMIGDGLNDAGALKQSDVGIALTDEVSNFTPACDAVLDASELKTLPTFMQFAKKCVTVIKSSFGLSLVYNAVGLFFAVQGTLSPLTAAILMPLSSITVVSFTTGLTNIYARRLKLLK
jgi:Cu+-exporting ATPase